MSRNPRQTNQEGEEGGGRDGNLVDRGKKLILRKVGGAMGKEGG